jgi:hypothetical protein
MGWKSKRGGESEGRFGSAGQQEPKFHFVIFILPHEMRQADSHNEKSMILANLLKINPG